MSPFFGWMLAAAAAAIGWQGYGWRGLALAVSVIVFWLLLQFSRSIRVMKQAASAPIGHVPSAVTVAAGLKQGMTLLEIVTLTNSLGREVSKSPETWAWSDPGGIALRLVLVRARLDRWEVLRPTPGDAE